MRIWTVSPGPTDGGLAVKSGSAAALVWPASAWGSATAAVAVPLEAAASGSHTGGRSGWCSGGGGPPPEQAADEVPEGAGEDPAEGGSGARAEPILVDGDGGDGVVAEGD